MDRNNANQTRNKKHSNQETIPPESTDKKKNNTLSKHCTQHPKKNPKINSSSASRPFSPDRSPGAPRGRSPWGQRRRDNGLHFSPRSTPGGGEGLQKVGGLWGDILLRAGRADARAANVCTFFSFPFSKKGML